MQDAERKKEKLKFKLNCGEKKNLISVSIRKNEPIARSSHVNGSGSPHVSSASTPSNNISGVAKRSPMEKGPIKGVSKNIKINLAGSKGIMQKSGMTTNRVNHANSNSSLTKDNSSSSSVSHAKQVGGNVSAPGKATTPNNASSDSKYYGSNVNPHESATFNDSLNLHDSVGFNDSISFNDSLSLRESINLNDSLNLKDAGIHSENLNGTGNVSEYVGSGGGGGGSGVAVNVASMTNAASPTSAANVTNAVSTASSPTGGGVQLRHGSKSPLLKSNLKIYYKNELIPFSFLYHKILTILKSHYTNHITNNPGVANKGISFFHIENMLINFGFKGVDISNHALLSYLASSKQIKVDLNEKRICYVNPYVDITSVTSLLHKINKHGFLYGYEINDDLINTNKDIYKWINTLLYEKKVRCIRSNNSHLRGKLKCKHLPSFCDIYAKNKCDNCFYNLKGYIFFPLSYEHIEQQRYSITNDIKNLWDEITLPNLDSILKEYKLKSTNKVFVHDNAPKRKNKEDKFSPVVKKMKRIYNTHLFTADEIKNEFMQKK
ncbi:conserved Plasmodium protein, unknown function [Plasmodium vivax]|uniref:Uncharacterized protein n=4 Tax=Plasmodium vivax TaxID=5855 RepID=A5K2X2_PLAVS|nr:hypothetical protein, conserved [Plasmodium vivax]KMZ85535.1 hypothetical protein PVBG_02221 [Plasmodium vivax Brazil I]KMZ98264.1 hypothetical protein PVNG_04874 [Plasmodium vivax North Korean]EDL45876.1 hypothetical protein, conserved [Plasmodium vivax]CAG9473447.1 unnamed protein product [Plasmodium vivax]CAI7722086.1 conserved Apicomplexan protein, unknown function [Plasmodium vivax]|eukprot:XP_001615603.1 hypothetical protein [Plasmodium vivax Sal-1]